MRKYFMLLLLAMFAKTASAQTDSLSIDENNKYIYYQVVDQPGINADSLYDRGLYFLKTAMPLNKLKLTAQDKAAGSLSASGSMLVSKKSLITAHEDGAVAFTLKLQVKEGRYRYWLTDFVYTPYQRDRYGSFVSVPGSSIPLEQAQSKITKSDFAGFRNTIVTNGKQIGDVLKAYMLKPSALRKDVKVNKISTKDW